MTNHYSLYPVIEIFYQGFSKEDFSKGFSRVRKVVFRVFLSIKGSLLPNTFDSKAIGNKNK